MPSIATHSSVRTHETPVIGWLGSISWELQLAPSFVEIATLPFANPIPPPTTHSALEEHDTAVGRTPTGSPRLVRGQVGATSAASGGSLSAGLVLVAREGRTAHSVLDGHEMLPTAMFSPTCVCLIFHTASAPPPLPGSVVVSAFPWLSPATHSVLDGHATLVREGLRKAGLPE